MDMYIPELRNDGNGSIQMVVREVDATNVASSAMDRVIREADLGV
jgi:hypothetical protein